MEYAVFASGGKQYKVTTGDIVELEKLAGNEGDQLTFDQVLLHVSNGTILVGQPLVSGAVVTGKILGQVKGKKFRVAKFKAKARYRKVHGHRQQLTKVQIEDISAKTVKEPKQESTKVTKSTKTKDSDKS